MTKALSIIFTVLKYIIVTALIVLLVWASCCIIDAKISDIANDDVPNRIEEFGLATVLCGLFLAIGNGIALILSLISFIIVKINKTLRKVKRLTIWYIVLMIAPVVNMLIFVLIAVIMNNYS